MPHHLKAHVTIKSRQTGNKGGEYEHQDIIITSGGNSITRSLSPSAKPRAYLNEVNVSNIEDIEALKAENSTSTKRIEDVNQ